VNAPPTEDGVSGSVALVVLAICCAMMAVLLVLAST
jgi:hypothetical protein